MKFKLRKNKGWRYGSEVEYLFSGYNPHPVSDITNKQRATNQRKPKCPLSKMNEHAININEQNKTKPLKISQKLSLILKNVKFNKTVFKKNI